MDRVDEVLAHDRFTRFTRITQVSVARHRRGVCVIIERTIAIKKKTRDRVIGGGRVGNVFNVFYFFPLCSIHTPPLTLSVFAQRRRRRRRR